MAAEELPVKPPATQKLIRTNQLKFLWNLLEELIRKNSATEFFSIRHNESVKNPMDLKTVQLRLKNHFYARGRDCIKDIHLIFSNACKYYYPDSIQVQNAKALENFFYAKLDDMPKPECELHATSHKSSKSTEVRKKDKRISPNRRKKEKKISPNRRKNDKKISSKVKKLPKMMEGGRNRQKNIPSKDKNSAIKEFQATVEEIMTDLTKLYRPLDYVDNLKLYDNLLKIKMLYEKFQKFSAPKEKKEDVKKIINTSLDTSATKKSESEKPLKSKGKMVVLPFKPVGGTDGLFLSHQKDVQLKSRSNASLPHKVKSNKEKITVNPYAKPKIVPSVDMVRPRTEKEVLEKPESKPVISNVNIVKSQKEKKENVSSQLEILLQSERFCHPAESGPTVTEERKRQREIAHERRESLGGKTKFCLAADIMRAFEYENGLYQYS